MSDHKVNIYRKASIQQNPGDQYICFYCFRTGFREHWITSFHSLVDVLTPFSHGTGICGSYKSFWFEKQMFLMNSMTPSLIWGGAVDLNIKPRKQHRIGSLKLKIFSQGIYSTWICWRQCNYTAVLCKFTVTDTQEISHFIWNRLHYWFTRARHSAKTCLSSQNPPIIYLCYTLLL